MGHFWLTFKNGYTLSVYNAFGSHTENSDNFEKQAKIIEHRDITATWKSTTVEIAILNKKGDIVTDKIFKDLNDIVATIDVSELISVINVLNLMKGEE